MAKTRSCVFCEATPLSAEHIWPEWLGEFFKSRGAKQWRYSHGGRHRISGGWDLTVKRVCGPCNFGWMSQIEGRAKEPLTKLLTAATAREPLSIEEQEVLSTWAYKTALVLNFLFRSPSSQFEVLPPSLYKNFFKSKGPPCSARVWASTYGGPIKGVQARRNSVVIGELAPDGLSVLPSGIRAFCTTIVIDRCMMQVVDRIEGDAIDLFDEPHPQCDIPWPAFGLRHLSKYGQTTI
jgi:hypothetical protein